MAKTYKVADKYTLSIKKGTGENVYQFSDADVAQYSTLNFIPESGVIPEIAKQGEDLIILSRYQAGTGYKVGITVVKDYYKYSNLSFQNIVKIDGISQYNYAHSDSIYIYATGNYTDSSAIKKILSDKKNTTINILDSESSKEILDISGNDTYNIKNTYNNNNLVKIEDLTGKDNYNLLNGSKTNISEKGGNDSYTIKKSNATINDIAGNDTYTATLDSIVSVYDLKGNDKYNFTYSNANVIDMEGNDKYSITYAEATDIDDYKGKDTYSFVGSLSKVHDRDGNDTYNFVNSEIDAWDEKGNDKYTGAYSNGQVQDNYGNDKYTFTNAYNLNINDGNGNDTYNFNGAKTLNIIEGYSAKQESVGNDKYIIDAGDDIRTLDHFGKDSYTISNTKGIWMKEDTGNDTYKLVNVSNAEKDSKYIIEDIEGDDKYGLSYADNLKFEDSSGKDSWSISSSDNIIITDSKGNDSYAISSSENISITDDDGDDKYTVNNLSSKVTIADSKGEDKLTVSGLNYKDVVLLANYTAGGAGKVTDESLFILDKNQIGYAQICDYFKTDSESNINGTGLGKIEKIYASKKQIVSSEDLINMAAIGSDVAAWISDNTGYTCVSDLLQNGTSTEIADLITFSAAQNNI